MTLFTNKSELAIACSRQRRRRRHSLPPCRSAFAQSGERRRRVNSFHLRNCAHVVFARPVVVVCFAQRIMFLSRAAADRMYAHTHTHTDGVIMIRACANLSDFGYTSIYYYISLDMVCVCMRVCVIHWGPTKKNSLRVKTVEMH